MVAITSQPRLLLGLHNDRDDVQAYRGDASLITCAKPGSGKDRCVILPNLVSGPGSFIITDPKGEDAEITAAWRAQFFSTTALSHPVHVFDPFGQCNPDLLPPGSLAQFNPLDYLRASRTPIEDAMQLASAMIPISHGDRDPHWNLGARSIFAAFILYVALDPSFPGPRTMRTAWKMLSWRGDDLQELLLKVMAASEVGEGFVAKEALDLALNSNEKAKDSFLGSIKTNCGAILNSPSILNNMDQTTVDFGTLTRRPATVYLVLPGKFAETHGRWFRLLLSCAFSQIENAGLIANEAKGPGITFLLNESFTLGKFDQIVEAMGRMRGYGVRFWTFVQNLSQLKTLYGDNWTNITGSADVIQYFGGTLDQFTAEHLSFLSGRQTVRQESSGETFGPHSNQSANISETGRAVKMPDEIMRFPSLSDRVPPEKIRQWITRAGEQNPYQARMIYVDQHFPEHAAFLRGLKSRARPYEPGRGFLDAGKGNGAASPPPGPAAPNFSYQPSPFATFKAKVGEVQKAPPPAQAAKPSPVASDGFRPVKPGEVFPPGCEFRMNVTTGEQEVRLP